MEKVILDEKEIIAINDFVELASDIPLVEAIYAISYKNEYNEERIELVAIKNDSLSYNEQLNKLGRRNISKEQKYLNFLVYKYQEMYKDRRLHFINDNILDYNVFLMTTRERKKMQTLISANILFDRFKSLEKIKKYIQEKNYLIPYSNINEIGNIKEITNETNEEKSLVTTKKLIK